MSTQAERVRKEIEDSNIVNVSMKRPVNFYVFLAKKYLAKEGVVEYHALGDAMTLSVQAAEVLVK
jgi:hypothetical protein